MKYRGKLELVAEVLAASLKDAKKTHIMNRGNLNFKLVNSYLQLVLSCGLLTFDSENESYSVTEKGERFLVLFKSYRRHVRESEKKRRIVEDKEGQLEQMCFPADVCNELPQSDEARAIE
jgi:predicted transcriptional regulator